MTDRDHYKKLKRRYLDGISKLYYFQNTGEGRRRNNIHCEDCHCTIGWYDRRDFNNYDTIPRLCVHCASKKPWWDEEPYTDISYNAKLVRPY